MKATYTIEVQKNDGRWIKHPWTNVCDNRKDANHGLKMLNVNEAPLTSLGLFGPLRITRTVTV